MQSGLPNRTLKRGAHILGTGPNLSRSSDPNPDVLRLGENDAAAALTLILGQVLIPAALAHLPIRNVKLLTLRHPPLLRLKPHFLEGGGGGHG